MPEPRIELWAALPGTAARRATCGLRRHPKKFLKLTLYIKYSIQVLNSYAGYRTHLAFEPHLRFQKLQEDVSILKSVLIC